MQFIDTVPPAARGITAEWKHQAEGDQLKQNPGKWALIDTYDKGAAANSASAAFKKRGFQSVTRRDQISRKTNLYARFAG